MCIAYFLWRHSQAPELLLVALFNRDELFNRPTVPTHVWKDQDVVGGRDLVAGGTWMCVSHRGRAAFLTNFRQRRDESVQTPASTDPFLESLASHRQGVPSRGALPVDFVSGEASPKRYLNAVDTQAFEGFNLIVADLARQRMAYLGSRSSSPCEELPPGMHAITNGAIHANWPKVDEGRRQLQSLLDSGAFTPGCEADCDGGDPFDAGSGGSVEGQGKCGMGGSGTGSSLCVPWEELFAILADDRQLEQDPARLPQTGYGTQFEAAASGIYVQPIETPLGQFGTRSQVVLAVRRDGWAELRERYRDDTDGSWKAVQQSFQMDLSRDEGQQGGGQLA
ncbi:hypothetical protein D9Q98_003546 [Chlorella vulgaris]|uniref:NRDE protein-domain-containing protein n=1 Tax=Chlorella vulgaris TaxID=3077 RepID=A0A9D4TSS5_CHLVU|nr:hypothetical protein D9Q98_003546 [Chlorella vulgaris]